MDIVLEGILIEAVAIALRFFIGRLVQWWGTGSTPGAVAAA
ncbi:MAG: hypothetical protein ACYCV7_05725 [Acidimicrobiales bacterium]